MMEMEKTLEIGLMKAAKKCDTCDVRNSVPVPSGFFVATAFVHVVELSSETSQQGAIAISYFNEVNLFSPQLEIGEVDVDDIAFGNFDGFPLMKVVEVVSWEVWRGHLSTCWEAIGFFWQSTYNRKML